MTSLQIVTTPYVKGCQVKNKQSSWSFGNTDVGPSALAREVAWFGELEGRSWNHGTQSELAYWLEKDGLGDGFASHSHFISRSSALLNFVRVAPNQPLEVTLAGRELIQGRALEDLFLRQLLKWQYPSPNHNDLDYRELFCIRPFLEMLRLVRDLDGLNKTEMALFGVSLTKYQDYDVTKRARQSFRERYVALADRSERGALVKETFTARVRSIYADDIASGRIGTREGQSKDNLVNLLIKKAGNLRDYADSALRYFLATGVFTISDSGRVYRLKILPERLEEVDVLLETTPREPAAYDDVESFYAYLGDPEAPHLPSDDLPVLQNRLRVLFDDLPLEVQQSSGLNQPQLQNENSPITLKTFESQLRNLAEANALAKQQAGLQEVKAVDDVLDMFTLIRKNEVPDRSLFFEWNVWRALSALDDGNIINNFEVDPLGQPRKLAPGGGPDIKCEYADFHLAVEVTLSYGATQYKMEGEPVNRHVGLLQKAVRDSDDSRPVYGLFIADKVNATVIAHFYGLHKFKTREFGGTVSVIPLSLDDFIKMVSTAQNRLPLSSSHLHDFFAEARRLGEVSDDEEEWYKGVKLLANSWLTPPAQG